MADSPMLASAQDLATLLRKPESDARLELALRRASARFIDAVGWAVLRVEDETIVLHGDGGKALLLPARNVTSASAKIGSDLIDDAILDRRLGILTRAPGWPDQATIEVTYTYGWAAKEIPLGIQDAVLEQAAHLALTTGAFQQETTGSSTVRWATGATSGVTQRWSETVDRYRVGIGERS